MSRSVENPEEQDVIRRVQAGQTQAYEILVRAHQSRVLSLCFSLMHNRAEAEDAAQDIFVKAWRNIGGFRFDSSFSTWVYRIAYHHCLDVLKSAQHRRTQSLDALMETEDRWADPGMDPSGPSERGETLQAMQAALAALPPDYRLVLTLREVEGLSYEEIARATDVSLDSVKARLRRARQALMEKTRHFVAPESVQLSGETQ